MAALDDNPFMTEEDHYHDDEDLIKAMNEATQAYTSHAQKKSNLAKYGRAVIHSVERYLKRHNNLLNTPILREDLVAPLRSVTVLLGGQPTDDNNKTINLSKEVAIQHCFESANTFEKQYAGHPIAGALIAFIGATLCFTSLALLVTSAGLFTPISTAGILIGSTLIASVVSGAGFSLGVGCTVGGLYLFNRPNHISRALLKLNKEANRMQAQPN